MRAITVVQLSNVCLVVGAAGAEAGLRGSVLWGGGSLGGGLPCCCQLCQHSGCTSDLHLPQQWLGNQHAQH